MRKIVFKAHESNLCKVGGCLWCLLSVWMLSGCLCLDCHMQIEVITYLLLFCRWITEVKWTKAWRWDNRRVLSFLRCNQCTKRWHYHTKGKNRGFWQIDPIFVTSHTWNATLHSGNHWWRYAQVVTSRWISLSLILILVWLVFSYMHGNMFVTELIHSCKKHFGYYW